MAVWTRKTKAVIVGGVAAAVAVSGTGVALAATSSGADGAPGATAHARLQKLQHEADLRFTAAQHRLDALRDRVDHVNALAADRSLLDQEIMALSSRVTTARQAVDAATTLPQARKDLRGDRVLVAQGRLIVRQVRQLRQADAAAIAAAKATTHLPALTAKVDALPAGSPAYAALTDLKARIADATTQAATITAADRTLNVSTPATANKTLTGNEAALTALRVDHRKAAADRRAILKALRASKKAVTPTSAG